jgi:uncharacterized paraquat-inducible protein A
MNAASIAPQPHGCTRCGGAMLVPMNVHASSIVRCPACFARVAHARSSSARLARQRTASLAIGALILLPAAITLPVLRISHFGQTHETGVLGGAIELLQDGYVVLGLVVLVCSVIVPVVKLLGLLVLSTSRIPISPRTRGRTWRLLEMSGKWGMLDVLLVACLVALVRLGELVDVQAGPGAVLFVFVVLLSLCAAVTFDPRSIRVQS